MDKTSEEGRSLEKPEQGKCQSADFRSLSMLKQIILLRNYFELQIQFKQKNLIHTFARVLECYWLGHGKSFSIGSNGFHSQSDIFSCQREHSVAHFYLVFLLVRVHGYVIAHWAPLKTVNLRTIWHRLIGKSLPIKRPMKCVTDIYMLEF